MLFKMMADKPFEGDETGLLLFALVIIIAFVIAWLIQR